jgi:hypothetical protein
LLQNHQIGTRLKYENFIPLEVKILCLGGCLGLEDGSFTKAWSKIATLLGFFNSYKMPPRFMHVLFTPSLDAFGGNVEVQINTLIMIHMFVGCYLACP